MREPTAADHRAAYPYFARITTRWMDNDAYAHVNNVVSAYPVGSACARCGVGMPTGAPRSWAGRSSRVA